MKLGLVACSAAFVGAIWYGAASLAMAQFSANGGYGQPPGGPGGDAGPQPNAMFDAIDADGDGEITVRELRKAVAALKQLDADKDGKITRDEISMGPGGRVGDPTAMVDRVLQDDKDRDGKLSKGELPRHLAGLLDTADTNKDGALDRAELTAALANQQGGTGGPAGQGGFNRPQGGFGPGNNFGSGANDPRPGVNLSQYDRNGDGNLSADEMPTQMRGMLRGTDQNGDGQLDAAEMQANSQRMNERLRGQRSLPPGVTVGPNGVQRKPLQ